MSGRYHTSLELGNLAQVGKRSKQSASTFHSRFPGYFRHYKTLKRGTPCPQMNKSDAEGRHKEVVLQVKQNHIQAENTHSAPYSLFWYLQNLSVLFPPPGAVQVWDCRSWAPPGMAVLRRIGPCLQGQHCSHKSRALVSSALLRHLCGWDEDQHYPQGL